MTSSRAVCQPRLPRTWLGWADADPDDRRGAVLGPRPDRAGAGARARGHDVPPGLGPRRPLARCRARPRRPGGRFRRPRRPAVRRGPRLLRRSTRGRSARPPRRSPTPAGTCSSRRSPRTPRASGPASPRTRTCSSRRSPTPRRSPGTRTGRSRWRASVRWTRRLRGPRDRRAARLHRGPVRPDRPLHLLGAPSGARRDDDRAGALGPAAAVDRRARPGGVRAAPGRGRHPRAPSARSTRRAGTRWTT